ncbi:MAG TPA: 50S ribosomal protein L21 [Candidatus Polarisedimenticolaceae bacterium]|nr:50S ribosomal protein L21 [Candidatus Polarisedimenticolaceae bacterium]
MFAVIQTGGKQYRVQVGEIVRVESVPAGVGDPVVFERVLLLGDEQSVRVGTPHLEGARVRATVVENDRAKKVLVHTYKKTKNASRRHAGHRQDYTAVKIDAIEA